MSEKENKKTLEIEIDDFNRSISYESQFIREDIIRDLASPGGLPENERNDPRRERIQRLAEQRDMLVSKREAQIKSSFQFLNSCVKLIENDKLRQIVQKILEDERFYKCPASRNFHQAYDGGLVVHTAEVLEIALSICRAPSMKINHDIVITACIFHDYPKIHDYVKNKNYTGYVETGTNYVCKKESRYEYTTHQSLIRHLPRAYAVFMEMVGNNEAEVSEELKMQIGHCILAHHGRKEWGSPVEPQTPEAHAIHCADMMSANCTQDYYKRN